MATNKVYGVSVLSIGPALGHGVDIDRAGLEQALECLKARGQVRLLSKHNGGVEDVCGKVTRFRIEGDQIKGDLELFDHPMKERLLEIAEKIPNQFGLSVESEYSAGSGETFRPSNIDAIALVLRPAANHRGLFGALRRGAKPQSFASIVEEKRRSGARNPVAASILANPESYTQYVQSFGPKPPNPSLQARFESAVKAQMDAGAKSPGAAILRVAADKPELYNAAREAQI